MHFVQLVSSKMVKNASRTAPIDYASGKELLPNNKKTEIGILEICDYVQFSSFLRELETRQKLWIQKSNRVLWNPCRV